MVDKRTVRRGYDSVAETFTDQRSFDEAEQQLFNQFLDSLPPNPRLLDAGCGAGTPVLERLRDQYSENAVVGLDFSATQLTLARERAPDASLVAGDMATLPIAESTVDGILAFYSLIHLPESQHQQAIAEFARVTRPGGRILVSEGAEQWAGTNPDWLGEETAMEWHIAGAAATREQLRNAGFRIETEWDTSDVLVDDESWVFFEAVNEE